VTTSGTNLFNPDLNEFCEEAFERAGREMRSGYDLRTARRSINLMLADWGNRGINLFTIEQNSINLVQGTNTYNLPLDTVDLLDHVIRTGDGNQATQSDLSITRISSSTYATIPNKLTQARPIQVWVQRLTGQTYPVASGYSPDAVAYPRITLWPTPNQAPRVHLITSLFTGDCAGFKTLETESMRWMSRGGFLTVLLLDLLITLR